MRISVRTIIGLLVAPAAFGMLLLILAVAFASPAMGLWALKLSAFVGFPMALIVGFPLFFLMSKFGWTGPLPYSIAALFFSAMLIAYFIIRPVMSEERELGELLLPARLGQMAILVFASFSTVFVFWFIARPDRQKR